MVEPAPSSCCSLGRLRAYQRWHRTPHDRPRSGRQGRQDHGWLPVVEISLVDRPANARCGVTLVKSADDGTPEYVGKVFGADDAIAKALGGP